MAFSDLWAGANPAFVALSELLQNVQRETGIPPADAASLLRPQLQMCAIRAAVLGAPEVLSGEMTETSVIEVFNEPQWLSLADWLLVNWNTGRLHDHQIYIFWADVMAALDQSQFSRSPDWRGNRGPQAEATSAGTVAAGSLKSRSKRSGGGRPTTRDWDAFWIEVAIWCEKNGFGDEDRQRLQAHMENWCSEHAGDPDTPTHPQTIRARLTKLYAAAHERNSG